MEAKILSSEVNRAVVHIPGRSFPGAVIQGDQLHCLVNRMTLACQLVERAVDKDKHPELWTALCEVRYTLEGIYENYMNICQAEEHRGDW